MQIQLPSQRTHPCGTEPLGGAEPDYEVREMPAAVNLSPARFSHLFVRTTGMLPRAFLRMLKQYQAERRRAVEVLSASNECL